jgi:hypothetical protein
MFDLSTEPVVVEESAEDLQVKQETLKGLVLQVEAIVQKRDTLLGEAQGLQEELRSICGERIVEVMQALGQSEVKLESGHKVALKVTPTAKIVEGQEQRAYDAMRLHGFGDNIKHNLFVDTVDDKYNDLRKAARVLEALGFEGVTLSTGTTAKEVSLFLEQCRIDDVPIDPDVFTYTSIPLAEVRLGRITLTKKPNF